MNKKHCFVAQLLLLIWFLFDMTGFYYRNQCLVTKSYRDDDIFFLIYLFTIILFLLYEKVGKWILITWLSMWFIVEFLCHEWYTIFNGGFMGSLDAKISFFNYTTINSVERKICSRCVPYHITYTDFICINHYHDICNK